jgi:hypothetical protein
LRLPSAMVLSPTLWGCAQVSPAMWASWMVADGGWEDICVPCPPCRSEVPPLAFVLCSSHLALWSFPCHGAEGRVIPGAGHPWESGVNQAHWKFLYPDPPRLPGTAIQVKTCTVWPRALVRFGLLCSRNGFRAVGKEPSQSCVSQLLLTTCWVHYRVGLNLLLTLMVRK